ncbi:MAG: type IV pilus modification PilV family protein [Planctomycetota bacterium]|jgi:hypothetical protein
MPRVDPKRRRIAASQGGVTLLEILFGIVLLAIGLMAQTASTLSEHRMVREQEYRSEALHVTKQFTERLRSDDDWAGLYARLRVLADAADTPGSGAVLLDDGREAYPPATYFSDFVPNDAMQDAVVLVDVPAAPLDADPTGPAFLREDVTDAHFGLPADLNGDGSTDGDARDGDYLVLPVRIIWRWVPSGEGTRELVLNTWIRGER